MGLLGEAYFVRMLFYTPNGKKSTGIGWFLFLYSLQVVK